MDNVRISPAVYLVLIAGLLAVESADVGYMRRVITDHFSDTRHHSPEYAAYKKSAERFIENEFKSFNLSTELHPFDETIEGVQYSFTNVIAILKGERFGTADDEILGLGAHYDTVNTTKGVDDNGSGVAAMLDVAKRLASGPTPNNTIIFASFDLEEYQLTGSYRLITGWFIDWLIRSYGKNLPRWIHGFIVLDTIFEYNTTANSQQFPTGTLAAIFPETTTSIASDNFRGDFMVLVYRKPNDSFIAETFRKSWTSASRSEYELESFGLPFEKQSDIPAEQEQLFYPFYRSDHANFWLLDFPAIFLTDSADFRGDMMECYHSPCDNLDIMLTDENMEFLGKTADALYLTIGSIAETDVSNSDTPGSGATIDRVFFPVCFLSIFMLFQMLVCFI